MSTNTSTFERERNAALFSLDRPAIERYLIKRGIPIPNDDVIFWAAIYKCICNVTSAPPEVVAQAKKWLYAHGMSEDITL